MCWDSWEESVDLILIERQDYYKWIKGTSINYYKQKCVRSGLRSVCEEDKENEERWRSEHKQTYYDQQIDRFNWITKHTVSGVTIGLRSLLHSSLSGSCSMCKSYWSLNASRLATCWLVCARSLLSLRFIPIYSLMLSQCHSISPSFQTVNLSFA